MHTTDIIKTHCSNCGESFEVKASLPESKPKQGDLTVCPACGQISVLDHQLFPRKITKQELTALMLEDVNVYLEVMNISAAIKFKVKLN